MHRGKITLVCSIFFCLILIVAFWNFIHIPAQWKILQLDLERQKLLQINENILNYKSKYGNLDEYMKTIEKRYQLANISLPEQMQQGEFVNFLQRVALENDVKIISLIPSAIQNPVDETSQDESPVINKLLISLKIESGYLQLISFLKAIESSERLVQIDNLSIIGKGDGTNLNCEIKLLIFSLE